MDVVFSAPHNLAKLYKMTDPKVTHQMAAAQSIGDLSLNEQKVWFTKFL